MKIRVMPNFLWVGFFLIISLLSGCTLSKKSSTGEKVIYGHYEIVKQEPYQAKDNALITGVIYDKKTGSPLSSAFVQVKEINKGIIADTLGKFSFEVPSGTYQIEVSMVGNTTLSTKPTKLEANTKTEIVFYLGATWMY